MAAVTETQREERIAAVLARAGAGQRGPRRAAGHLLARVFPPGGPGGPGRTHAGGPAGRAAVALAARRAAPAGAPKVRVFSPPGADGWGSRHTIVQVVNDDMPFLVDSVSLEIARQGLSLHLIVHPIFAVQRDAQGVLQSVAAAMRAAAAARIVDVHRGRSRGRCAAAPRWPAASSACWPTCAPRSATGSPCSRACTRPRGARERPAPVDRDEAQESRAFLDWLAGDHFTLLGYRSTTGGAGRQLALKLVEGSGLGVLRAGHGDSRRASPRCRRPRARWRARLRRCW